MKTKSEQLETYKNAIRAQFLLEQNGPFASYLTPPSRAKLRQLCEERFKNGATKDDFWSFKLVFGFDYEASNRNKLKEQTDKFRPIETFLKGETDLMDKEAINLAAFLVNFQWRPFQNFMHHEHVGKEITSVENKMSARTIQASTLAPDYIGRKPNRKLLKILISTFLLVTIGILMGRKLINEEKCMQWTGIKYEKVSCDESGRQNFVGNHTEPFEVQQFSLHRVEVTPSTVFFVRGKPVIWYTKVNGKPEFFNQSGFHPETGKPLKPITPYIIAKWVK